MPEVTTCTENVVIPALGVGISFKQVRLEYPLEYFVQHLSFRLPLLIQVLLSTIAVLNWNRQESDPYNGVH